MLIRTETGFQMYINMNTHVLFGLQLIRNIMLVFFSTLIMIRVSSAGFQLHQR